MFIGDTPNDVRAAIDHDAPSIGLATGHHTATQLRNSGATLVLDRGHGLEELDHAVSEVLKSSHGVEFSAFK